MIFEFFKVGPAWRHSCNAGETPCDVMSYFHFPGAELPPLPVTPSRLMTSPMDISHSDTWHRTMWRMHWGVGRKVLKRHHVRQCESGHRVPLAGGGGGLWAKWLGGGYATLLGHPSLLGQDLVQLEYRRPVTGGLCSGRWGLYRVTPIPLSFVFVRRLEVAAT